MKEITIQPALESDKIKIANVIKRIYPVGSTNDYELNIIDFNVELIKLCPMEELSLKIMCGKKIIGFNLLYEERINCIIHKDWYICDMASYYDKRGLKSVFLGIEPKYRRKGIGTMIMNYIRENYKEFDYLWGCQRYGVSTIEFFLKHRRIIAKKEDGFYTLMDIKQ